MCNKKDSIVDRVSAMESCFIYGKYLIFALFTAHFGGFEGAFCFIYDKSAILCLDKTETADFVSFKGSIVQGLVLTDKMDFQISFTECSSIYPLVPIGSN